MREKTILDVRAAKHIGGKPKNEDCIYVPTYPGVIPGKVSEEKYSFKMNLLRHGAVFAVADGISSGGGGGVASYAAVEAIHNCHGQHCPAHDESIEELCDNLNNATITALQNNGFEMGGTTIALAWFCGSKAMVSNIGDSPVYLYRQGQLQLLSRPHTLAALKEHRGIATINEADNHTLYHYLGNPDYTGAEQAYINNIDIQDGDIFLLCSDGLFDLYDEDELPQMLESSASAEEIIEMRVALAEDNVSLIIIKVTREKTESGTTKYYN